MTALKAALLTALASVVAAWVLWRVWRGRPAIAEGQVTARAIHIAALVLVLVGVEGDRSAAQPRTSPDAGPRAPTDQFPVTLRGEGINTYGRLHTERGTMQSLGATLTQMDEPGWSRRPARERTEQVSHATLSTTSMERGATSIAPLARLLGAALARASHPRPYALGDLTAILDAADQAPSYDAWLGAWVWRRSGDVRMTASERAGLLAKIERHLRVAETLERAIAQTGPVQYVPWRKKSMAPRGYSAVIVPEELVPAAEQLYPTIQVTSWRDEGGIDLVVDPASTGAELWRRGERTSLPAGATFRLGRLDVVAATARLVVRHATLGPITLRAGTSLHARGLSALLDARQRAQVVRWITSARSGDQAAITAIESSLPACQALVRAELDARPTSAGAARLRTLLTLFDE